MTAPSDEATRRRQLAVIGGRADRAATMRERHKAALDRVFGKPGVKYEVLGEVHLPKGQKFITPFGNAGRNGWVIREVGSEPPAYYTIGARAMVIAVTEYHVIDVLPPPAPGTHNAYRRAKAEATARAEPDSPNS